MSTDKHAHYTPENDVAVMFLGVEVDLEWEADSPEELPEDLQNQYEDLKNEYEELDFSWEDYRKEAAAWDSCDKEQLEAVGVWSLSSEEYTDERDNPDSPIGTTGLTREKEYHGPVSSYGADVEGTLLLPGVARFEDWNPIFKRLKEDAEEAVDSYDFAVLLESDKQDFTNNYRPGDEVKGGEAQKEALATLNGLRKRAASTLGEQIL